MKKTEHTPGPWRTVGNKAGSWSVLSGNICLAVLARKDCLEWNEANARLIAAAPELLEALQNLQPLVKRYLVLNINAAAWKSAFEKLEEAVSKATSAD